DARPAAGAPTAPAGAGERTGGARPRRFGALVPSLDYYWPEVLRGAEEAAAALGTQVVLRASSYEAVDERPQLALLLDSGVAGLLVALRTDAPSAASTVDWLVGTGVPLVLLERSATTGPHAAVVESVVTDHVLGAAMAVRHLAALGHRRVALVTTEQSPTSPHLQRGWAEALREAGLHRPDDLERWVPSTRSPDLGAALDEVVERCLATGTTAVLAHADAEAVALVARLEARGLSVPEDLSVVAYDDEVASLVQPPLTAVRPPRRSVGRAAVELLAARVADPARPAHRVLVSPALRVRASTAAPPARPGDAR
ncbi:LacI family DNA-binding transcriptional regulator, partial [Pseudokineococcus marinus]